jgi:antitoxin component HigA of HigAB toxin-antitoxin module
MKTKQANLFQSMPVEYALLCRVFLPRPIHDDVAYQNTVEVADIFAGFEDEMTADQNDYFDLLCELIAKYEAAKVTPLKLCGTALLKHFIEEHSLSAAEVSRILGKSTSLGPMILRGERKITANHAVSLGRHFGIRPDVFL